MSFPETRPTLIARLAHGGVDADWQQFVRDYWGPLVRFAARVGNLSLTDAEELVAETFLLLLRSPLLSRWKDQPTGRLRGFICGVVRHQLSNQQRVTRGRKRLLQLAAEAGGVPGALAISETPEPTTSDLDQFYRAWVDELLARTMRVVFEALQSEGRGDYFRALYGRVCEGLSAQEIGEALDVPAGTVENYLRVAKTRLSRALREEVRGHLERYCAPAEIDEEFEREWTLLAEHLERFGGMDEAIRQEANSRDRIPPGSAQSESFMIVSAQLKSAATDSPTDR